MKAIQWLFLGAVLAGACRSEAGAPLAPAAPESPPVDLVAGRAAFTSVCAACHSSRDGFDLAFFGFPDSTIVRRAVAHVDSATARNIAAHVRTVASPRASRTTRLFQPGGVLLVGGDFDFAIGVFGVDLWPEDLTTARLREIDPLAVKAAVPFPRWSVEFDNLDWMPDQPLPDGVLDHAGGAARRALATYYASPSLERLVAAVGALRAADRDPQDPSAPCARIGEGPLVDAAACFDVRRWTSTLAAQQMMRLGLSGRVHSMLHDTWWDVGDAARLAPRSGGVVANGTANWASWMYLGWVFEPSRHASVYTGSGLMRLGLPRHATFVALRSQVARPPGSVAVYADAANGARFAPAHWAYGATRFAFAHLLERLASGERPVGAERIQEARLQVQAAYAAAAPKVTPTQRAELARQRDLILAALS